MADGRSVKILKIISTIIEEVNRGSCTGAVKKPPQEWFDKAGLDYVFLERKTEGDSK